MKTNRAEKVRKIETTTHGGAKTYKVSPEKELRRSVMSCFLWEKSFYEDGISIVERIKSLIPKVSPITVATMAVDARTKHNLRHVPLMLAREMCRHDTHRPLVSDTLENVIQRADELGEFLSLYYLENKNIPLCAQAKKGLARAFCKFDEYQFRKYNRGAFTPRDVMFLVHPAPIGRNQTELFKKIANNNLSIADTWEVELSAGQGRDKKQSWERLLLENKLGASALLKNLRNMIEAGVSDDYVRKALCSAKVDRILPFRFITAARYAKRFEPELEQLMYSCLRGRFMLKGKTVLVVDVSGSMNGRLSEKSELSRLDAAAALSILARELCENAIIYVTAGNDSTRIHETSLLPARRGFALSDSIIQSIDRMGGGGIFTQQAVNYIHNTEKTADRMIIFSDSQDCDLVNKPENTRTFADHNYLIDISCEKNGIAYNKFTQINGFSESTLDYIYHTEENGD